MSWRPRHGRRQILALQSRGPARKKWRPGFVIDARLALPERAAGSWSGLDAELAGPHAPGGRALVHERYEVGAVPTRLVEVSAGCRVHEREHAALVAHRVSLSLFGISRIVRACLHFRVSLNLT